MITFEMVLVILITAAILYLFATEKFTYDTVALMTIVVLMLTGLVSPAEGVSGFANPATITVLSMFIISAGIQKTGVVHILGEKMLKFAKTMSKQLGSIIMISPLGGLINNTASVSILLPMVMDLTEKTKTYATQLLIPLSYISMAAGTLTLLGTSTNILANDIYVRAGFEPIGLFEITKLGIIVFAIVALYFFLVGRFMLPSRKAQRGITDPYKKLKYTADAIIPAESPIIYQKVKENKLKDYNIKIMRVTRGGRKFKRRLENKNIKPNDTLVIRGSRLELLRADRAGLVKIRPSARFLKKKDKYILEQFMISENSSLVNRTLRSFGFKDRYNAVVLALKRGEKKIRRSISSLRLKFADILLLKGKKETMDLLKMSDDLIYIGEVQGPYRTDKMKYALGILALVVLLASFNIVSIMAAALTGVVLMVLFRVLTLDEGYKAVNWRIIFLLAGIIPLGIAMTNTGTINLLADGIVKISGNVPPIILLGLFYLITTLLTEIISNNAAVIVMVPLGLSVSTTLGLNPFAFVAAVMFAASTSFLTPIGYQTNTMVYTAGNYKFTDFLKIGAPLNLILLFASTYLITLIWGL
ncbi:SLC13 family permease [Candidatus Woesearchaeota archaeon]|nr:SLC13 family permease [Candidatus Woesearchaeota archaeon]